MHLSLSPKKLSTIRQMYRFCDNVLNLENPCNNLKLKKFVIENSSENIIYDDDENLRELDFECSWNEIFPGIYLPDDIWTNDKIGINNINFKLNIINEINKMLLNYVKTLDNTLIETTGVDFNFYEDLFINFNRFEVSYNDLFPENILPKIKLSDDSLKLLENFKFSNLFSYTKHSNQQIDKTRIKFANGSYLKKTRKQSFGLKFKEIDFMSRKKSNDKKQMFNFTGLDEKNKSDTNLSIFGLNNDQSLICYNSTNTQERNISIKKKNVSDFVKIKNKIKNIVLRKFSSNSNLMLNLSLKNTNKNSDCLNSIISDDSVFQNINCSYSNSCHDISFENLAISKNTKLKFSQFTDKKKYYECMKQTLGVIKIIIDCIEINAFFNSDLLKKITDLINFIKNNVYRIYVMDVFNMLVDYGKLKLEKLTLS